MSCPPHAHCWANCGDDCDIPMGHFRICYYHECDAPITDELRAMMEACKPPELIPLIWTCPECSNDEHEMCRWYYDGCCCHRDEIM